MSFTQNTAVSAADINALKAAVTAEMDRRQYVNSLKGTYGTGTTYEYTTATAPASNRKILIEHQTKIAVPLNAIDATGVTSATNTTKLSAADLTTLQNKLDVWSAISADSTSSGCTNATCQGLCQNTCSGTCKTTCTTNCATNDNCGSGCASTCSTTCATSSNCSTTCAVNSGCGSGCANSCGGGCGDQCISSAPCRESCKGGNYP